MTLVRSSESKQNELEVECIPTSEESEVIEMIYSDVEDDADDNEGFVKETEISEEHHVFYEESDEDDDYVPEAIVEPPPKKVAKVTPSPQCGAPQSLIALQYSLEKIEGEQRIIMLISNNVIMTPDSEGNYNLEQDEAIINHSDSAYIYKCRHCPKAFGSANYLLQHNKTSHLCLICLENFTNYIELNKHVRQDHSQTPCPFCVKSLTLPNYRQHLKKQHSLQLPAYIGVLGVNK